MGVFQKFLGFTGLTGFFSRPTGPVDPMQAIGTGGTTSSGGYLEEKDTTRELQGLQKFVTFSNTLADLDIVSASVLIYEHAIGRAGWRFQPPDESPEAQRVADLMFDVANDMETGWTDVIARMAMFSMYGYSIQEWTAKMRPDGAIGFLDIEPRSQKSIEQWDEDDSGRIIGVVQRTKNQRKVYLPREKLVYAVDKVIDDSPAGVGIFRFIHRTAQQLRALERLEIIGYERDLRGVPIARFPYGRKEMAKKAGQLSDKEIKEQEKEFKDFVSKGMNSTGTGFVLESAPYQTTGDSPSLSTTPLYDIQLLRGDSKAHEPIGGAIMRKQRQMARVFGTEEMLLGDSSSGSFALSEAKAAKLLLKINAILRKTGEVVNRDIIKPWGELNGIPPALLPKAKHDKVSFRDLEAVAEVVGTLARSGIVLTREDEAVGELYDNMGLTRPKVIDEGGLDLSNPEDE